MREPPAIEFAGIGMTDRYAADGDITTFAKVATGARLAYENAMHGMYAAPDVARAECIKYLRQAAEALECELIERMTEESLLAALEAMPPAGPLTDDGIHETKQFSVERLVPQQVGADDRTTTVFGATISPETQAALKAVDDNMRNAAANAHNIIVGADDRDFEIGR